MVRNRHDSASRDRSVRTIFEYVEPVRFIDWYRLSGAYTAVLLIVAVAVLSFITGMSHLSRPGLSLEGPLAPYLPPGFIGVQRILGVVIGGYLLGRSVAGDADVEGLPDRLVEDRE